MVLGILSVSIYLAGGNILSFAALSPFLLILIFPAIAALAIWPANQIITAFKSSLSHNMLKKTDLQSIKILDFCEKISFLGVLIGLIIGLIIILLNTEKITFERVYIIGNHALTGVIAALVISITLKQLSVIFISKSEKLSERKNLQPNSLKHLCETYGITMREKEIIKMISEGASNREISRVLDITDDTVKNHVYNIFRKTGVKNRNGLVGLLLEEKKTDNA
jgi:DNA-binding CsgD family transcriptional regulator